MQITINLNDLADVRAGLEMLPKYLPADLSTGPFEVRLVNNLWPRLGRNMRKLVKQVHQHPGPLTIETLAKGLDRPARSVRSSLNGPLARAIKSARQAVPGAPELFDWRHNGAVYELDLTPEMRAALDSKSVNSDFDAIPQPD